MAERGAVLFGAFVLVITFGFGFAFGRVTEITPPCPRFDPVVVSAPIVSQPPVRGYMLLGACWEGTKWGRKPDSRELWFEHDLPPLCRKPFGYPAELTMITRREGRLMSKPWSDPMEPEPVLGQVKAWSTVRLSGIQRSDSARYGDDLVLWMATAEVMARNFVPVTNILAKGDARP